MRKQLQSNVTFGRSLKDELAAREQYSLYCGHGQPFDRGASDYYYGRPPKPHKYTQGTYNGEPEPLTDPEELAAYWAGYNTQVERKDWQ